MKGKVFMEFAGAMQSRELREDARRRAMVYVLLGYFYKRSERRVHKSHFVDAFEAFLIILEEQGFKTKDLGFYFSPYHSYSKEVDEVFLHMVVYGLIGSYVTEQNHYNFRTNFVRDVENDIKEHLTPDELILTEKFACVARGVYSIRDFYRTQSLHELVDKAKSDFPSLFRDHQAT